LMMNPVPWLQMTNMISYQGLVRTFPNDSNSVYKDYDPRGKDDTTGGVYPDQDTGITYPLHFQATLQQDGTIPIEAGEFKATSTFQVTYP
ncbi:hypothetical protein ACP0F6_08835, partial [Escherichia coli]